MWSVFLKDMADDLTLDAADAWLQGVHHLPSPNCDERPTASEPELVVIHSNSLPEGIFGTPHVEALLCN